MLLLSYSPRRSPMLAYILLLSFGISMSWLASRQQQGMAGDAEVVLKTLATFLSKGQLSVELFSPLSLVAAAHLPSPLGSRLCGCAQGTFAGLLAWKLQLLAESDALQQSRRSSPLARKLAQRLIVLCAALLPLLWTGSGVHVEPSHLCATAASCILFACLMRTPSIASGYTSPIDHILGLSEMSVVVAGALGADVVDLAASYFLLAASRVARTTGRYLSVVVGGKPSIVDRESGRLMGEDDAFLRLEVGTWVLERGDGSGADSGTFRLYHPVFRCYLATSFRVYTGRDHSGTSNDTVARVLGRVSEAVCTRGVGSDASVLGIVEGTSKGIGSLFFLLSSSGPPSTNAGTSAFFCYRS
ncbi:hypothetical protein PspLS_03660 [Pyricularia sp. CBS 133598]|nr:hypothetical protein PspLS_03660 [Pyricularia sp. CBS 133598]